MQYSSFAQSAFEPSRFPSPLLFTPAEWRRLLEGPAFLSQVGNSYSVPRRLMGLPVKIVPDRRPPS
jgi:hypothetical protein